PTSQSYPAKLMASRCSTSTTANLLKTTGSD
ncbi:MAG: hypothetical protein ACI84R_002354, partial [Candidatus Azotimanducaceae bacterium]